jgi:hypothetical protein
VKVCALVLALGVGLVGLAASQPNASVLRVSQVPTPAVGLPYYRTTGSYPRVSRRGLDLRAVNAGLRRSVVDAERAYARRARTSQFGHPPRWKGCGGGIYDTSEQPRFVTASTMVVSALIPVLSLYPCGNDGAVWMSVTVRVPSGSRVTITDLFVKPSVGLRALAAAARTRLEAEYRCVRDAVHDPTAGRSFGRGFDPTPANYKEFALRTGGITIGFPLGQVAFPPCYRQNVTVPYRVVRPYLSALGRVLIAGVRRPL